MLREFISHQLGLSGPVLPKLRHLIIIIIILRKKDSMRYTKLQKGEQLMRDEFSKHRCLGQECRRLLEAAEEEVSRSFLCLWFVVSQSVMPVELYVYLAEQNALL